MEFYDAVVVGAGVSGLSCARALADQGWSVVVLDRSARVGGRCASKAVDRGPVADLGPVFIHGDDPGFLSVVRSVEGLVPGWPHRVRGTGTPCQPAAFEPGQWRFGVTGGINALARGLAAGLNLVLGVEALGWSRESDGLAVTTTAGPFRGRHLVWALAPDQTRGLLAKGPGGPSVASATALLASFSCLPSLALLVQYPRGTPVPDWDLWYPETSPVLLVSNEVSKRPVDPVGSVVLTIQSRPAWAARRLEDDRTVWTAELLAEAAGVVGAWAAEPEGWVAHRWKYGRLGPADHLARPLVFEGEGKGVWALVGDLFDPAGGLQGAWRSGQVLAQRLSAAAGR